MSTGSIHSTISPSVAPMSSIAGQNSLNQQIWTGNAGRDAGVFGGQPAVNAASVGSDELRQPMFAGFGNIDTSSNFAASNPASAAASSVTSPISAMQPLSEDGLFLHDMNQSPISLVNAFASLNALNSMSTSTQMQSQPQIPNPMLFDPWVMPIQWSALSVGFDSAMDDGTNLSQLSESIDDSVFSAFGDRSSAFYSESVCRRRRTAWRFPRLLGRRRRQQRPAEPAVRGVSANGHFSPMGMSNNLSPIFNLEVETSPGHASGSAASPMSASRIEQEEQIRQLLVLMQQQQQPQQPATPPPVITHVIPAEGPLAGGITVAIAGQRFAPGMVIMFRIACAKTTFVSESFVQCTLPPAVEPDWFLSTSRVHRCRSMVLLRLSSTTAWTRRCKLTFDPHDHR